MYRILLCLGGFMQSGSFVVSWARSFCCESRDECVGELSGWVLGVGVLRVGVW